MLDYETLYRILFNGITDAIYEIDNRNYGADLARLVQAQQAAEDVFISAEE
jgi:hypothetical protein